MPPPTTHTPLPRPQMPGYGGGGAGEGGGMGKGEQNHKRAGVGACNKGHLSLRGQASGQAGQLLWRRPHLTSLV